MHVPEALKLLKLLKPLKHTNKSNRNFLAKLVRVSSFVFLAYKSYSSNSHQFTRTMKASFNQGLRLAMCSQTVNQDNSKQN